MSLLRIILCACVLTAALGASAQDSDRGHKLLVPSVMVSQDELANPHLYYPRVTERYIVPPGVLGPPPPVGSVRPGEFDPLDSTLITVIGADQVYGPMWVDMVETYANAGHTWIIIPDNEKDSFKGQLDSAGISDGDYSFLNYPVNSIWVRDYGPEFAMDTSGERYIFDSYYWGRPLDDQVPILIGGGDWLNSDGSPVEVNTNEHELAGGNVMSDGAGTCFFSHIVYGLEKPSGWSDQDVDDLMAEYLGCEQMIVLNPICLDMTGHIDLYAKMMGPTSILLAEYPVDTHFDGTVASGETGGFCSTPDMPNDYQDQEDNLAIIQASTNIEGDAWEVTRLQLPEPYDSSGWIYRSYMNSEIMNNWVAMPSFYAAHGDETAQDLLDLEAAAIAAYETALPGVNVVAIGADHMNGSGGAIHCISHDIPQEAGGNWTAPAEYCGDGIINGDEDCDGDDMGGATCADYDLGVADVLMCNIDCTIDTSQCPGPDCGNGILDDGEECDPCALEQPACSDWDLGSGNVGCHPDCTFAIVDCPEASACDAAAVEDPGVVCCPDTPPANCALDSWSWSSEGSFYGCCTQDLKNSIWCEGASYNNRPCDGACWFIADGPFVDCDDHAIPGPADEVDCSGVDYPEADAGTDAGTTKKKDDGCGCASVGYPSVSNVLSAILSILLG